MTLSAAPAAAATPPGFFAISVSASVICLVLAWLLKWKTFRKIEFLIPWFCLLGGIGLAAAFLQSWVVKGASLVQGVVPIVGVAVGVVVAVVLLFIVIYDLWPKHPTNGLTSTSAFLLPSFVPLLGGAVGAAATSVLSYLAVGGATIIGAAFGVK